MNKIDNFEGVPFIDFIELKGLQPGMKISFYNIEEKLIVGNCTPHLGVSNNDGGFGWNLQDWKGFLVREVEYDKDNYITPLQMKIIRENTKKEKEVK